MSQKGNECINCMQDLNRKFGSTLTCSVEQVALFSGDFHHVMDAKSTFNQEALSRLLSSRAMVVPFLDYKHEPGLLSIITQVVNYLTVKLRELLDQNDGMGGYDAVWSSYQYEMALEELFFGHPLSHFDKQFSVSLGICSENVHSVTFRSGFCGLAFANSSYSV